MKNLDNNFLPIRAQIGGGDLDGDMFFVSAYPDIVDNVKEEAPAEYPTPKQRAVREGEDMLEHVSTLQYILNILISYYRLKTRTLVKSSMARQWEKLRTCFTP